MWCIIYPVNNLSIAIWGQKWLLYWYLGGALEAPLMGATESDTPWEIGLMVAFPGLVFVSFLYCPFVFSKISFWCCLFFALVARVLDFSMLCKMHCPHGYLTSSCTALLCQARSPFVVAWWLHCLQGYLTPSCTALLCRTRLPFVLTW